MVMLARTRPCASTISSARPRSTGATSCATTGYGRAGKSVSTARLTTLRAMTSRSCFIVPSRRDPVPTEDCLRVGCLRVRRGLEGAVSAFGWRAEGLDSASSILRHRPTNNGKRCALVLPAIRRQTTERDNGAVAEEGKRGHIRSVLCSRTHEHHILLGLCG